MHSAVLQCCSTNLTSAAAEMDYVNWSFPLWINQVFFSSLGESIAANNAYRQRESELSVKRVAVQEVPPPSVLDSSSGSSRSIHSLVEKIQNGLEVESVSVCWYCKGLCFTPLLVYFQHHRPWNAFFFSLTFFWCCLQLQEHVKDSHVSDIINVYEHKLSAFAVSTLVRRITAACECGSYWAAVLHLSLLRILYVL